MLLLLFVFAILTACQPSLVMKTVAVPRTDLVPKSLIRGSYTSPENNVAANFKWNTARPTLNLDNFNQITNIDCLSEMIVVTFNSTEAASSAFEAWSGYNDLALIVGHEHRCKGNEHVATLGVREIIKLDTTRMIFDTQLIGYEELVEDFELHITEPVHNLHKRKASNMSTTLNLNVNYDPKTKRAKNPYFQFLDYVKCGNCYVTGHAVISFHIKSKRGIIQDYKLNIKGSFEASMDLQIKTPLIWSQELVYQRLASITLQPYQVPGIFVFGPTVRLDAGVLLDWIDNSNMHFGFHYNKKFDYTVQGKPFGNTTKNYLEKGGLIPHESKNKQKHDLALGISAHLLPGIELGLSIDRKQIFSIAAEFDTSLETRAGEGMSNGVCKNNLSINLVRRDAVQGRLMIKGKFIPPVPVWSTGAKTIQCPFCQVCLMGKPEKHKEK